MANKIISFSDEVKFTLLDASLMNVKDNYSSLFTPGGSTQNGLQVKIAATHSGIIINNRLYLPDKVKQGTSSFTDNFCKPVLLHHQEEKDAVGRIIQSTYIDTSNLVTSKYNGLSVKNKQGKEVGKITDVLIQDFISQKMPFGMQVDVVRNLLQDSLLEDPDYQGLGYIEIIANITDKVTIEKLLDGRYLTGSVGISTDNAVCSVCKQSWAEEPCDHKPGALYDGVKCFLITGNMWYNEYSFVNHPADKFSKVLSITNNGVQKDIEFTNNFGRIYEARITFPQFDSVDMEGKMKEEKKNETVTDSATVTQPAPMADATTVQTTDSTQPQDQAIQKVEDKKVETEDEFLTRVINAEAITNEDEEKLYGMIAKEMEDAVKEQQLEVKDIQDAKLSSEQRKKLSSSTFCGPGRSFPCNDCAHVTAARRLIGRYKGPGDKDKILTCVNRKAKALGCDKKKDSVEEKKTDTQVVTPPEVTTTPTTEVTDSTRHISIMHSLLQALETGMSSWGDEPTALDDEDKKALGVLLKKLAGIAGKDSLTTILVQENLVVNPSCVKVLEDEIVKNETTIGELRDEIDRIKTEYITMTKDVEQLQDSIVKEKTKNRSTNEKYFTFLTSIKNAKVEQQDLSKFEDVLLETEVDKLSKEVDILQITDKLNNGMSRVPTGTVENPIDSIDDKQEKRFSVESLQDINEEYLTLRMSRGEQIAEAYLERMKREGKLPKD